MKKLIPLLAGTFIAGTLLGTLGLKRLSKPEDTIEASTSSAVPDDLRVLRTPGGRLEVALIKATERFEKAFYPLVFKANVVKTWALISVPATYRYHVDLSRAWAIRRSGRDVFIVAPAAKPDAPVAVDLGQLRSYSNGNWLLVSVVGAGNKAELQSEITQTLATRANSKMYLELQRPFARKTVEEFVRKWVITQDWWKSTEKPVIHVTFSDEPVVASDR